MTTNGDGKMQKINGKSIFTGAFRACSLRPLPAPHSHLVRLGTQDPPDRHTERVGLKHRQDERPQLRHVGPTCAASRQQDTLGHHGRAGDPFYRVRRTLRTRTALLTGKQKARLEAVFAADEHVAVEVTWRVYQQIIDAYAHPGARRGKTLLSTVMTTSVPGYQPGSRNSPNSDAASSPRRRPGLLRPLGIQRSHRGHGSDDHDSDHRGRDDDGGHHHHHGDDDDSGDG
jgi:hypothetical protein